MTRAPQSMVEQPDLITAGQLLAVDPIGLGGARLHGLPGVGRTRWMRWMQAALPSDGPWIKVPVNVTLDRLLGGLDVAASLNAGRPLFARGLLATVNGGVLTLAMAERLPRSVAAIIALTMDRREVLVERDGFTDREATEFTVLAFDEAMEDEEGMDIALADRLAFRLEPDAERGFRYPEVDVASVRAARNRLPRVAVSDDALAAIAASAAAVGAKSSRAEFLTLRAARAAAALSGRNTVDEEDLTIAARLVLAPRATQVPANAEDAPREPPSNEAPSDGNEEQAQGTEALDDVVLDAVRAAVPEKLLAALAAQGRSSAADVGRFGPDTRGQKAGRPVGSRPTESLHGQRLHVLDTLKAAAPWQRIRRAQSAEKTSKLRLTKDDLRAVRLKQRAGMTTVFVVDASGSQAARRLREVKGAIELLLAECYVRRDEVALIAFRGEDAQILLPPTRALALARRLLASLPGGGATPLASGIDAARDLVELIRRRGRQASVVFLTDGRANVGRDASVGHAAATEHALHAARLFRALGVASVLVDTSPRPRPHAKELALALGARYAPLPHADAGAISAAVRPDVAA